MYTLHPQLQADTFPVCDMELCEARLMNDRRFPWVILVPRRDGVTEVHQLSADEQNLLIHESSLTAGVLSRMFEADKINVAALGNLVPQLHWHVIARSRGDKAWPGPVWGYGERLPYEKKESAALLTKLQDTLRGMPCG
jgi:diadenosine tetraphosphate (Ap4A) HIT family hydrolase